jgi:hypothetical protein
VRQGLYHTGLLERTMIYTPLADALIFVHDQNKEIVGIVIDPKQLADRLIDFFDEFVSEVNKQGETREREGFFKYWSTINS